MSENIMYSLEGNIAAGKSSLGKALHETGALAFLPEPVEQWRTGFASNLLADYYADAHRWAFTLQICAFITRAKTWSEILARADHARVLMERSVFSDRYVFAELMRLLGNMDDTEHKVYRGLWDFLARKWAVRPTSTFYLRTPAIICLERIAERGRPEEAGIDCSFLRQIETLHDNWLLDPDYDGPVVVLDGRKPIKDLVAEVLAHVT